jgi:ribosomal protein L4
MEGGGVTLDLNQKGILKLNKKERRLALQTLLYKKKNILIIENLENEITEPKNKGFFKGL